MSPFLVGSYEAELHPVVEEIIASEPLRLIDVGSAEGYYAVGFARRLPHTDIFAFDIDENARRLCSEMAALNGVADRVHVAGGCSGEDLERLLTEAAWVVSDCEGGELELLDPDASPSLRRASILVELHDCANPMMSRLVPDRFRTSHSVQIIDVQPRDCGAYQVIADLESHDQLMLFDEHRCVDHPTKWAVLRPIGGITSGQ